MGTNFYLVSSDYNLAYRSAPEDVKVESIYDGNQDKYMPQYFIHIAKTSMGWLPLFQWHYNGIQSVQDYHNAYNKGMNIVDEYGKEYNWEQFTNRVLKFNGGVRGIQKPEKIKSRSDTDVMIYRDYNLPDYIPISHISGNIQSYKYDMGAFVDEEGYEFIKGEFS